MDPKQQTLNEVNKAIKTINKARADSTLTTDQRYQLESAYEQLRDVEKSIIELQQQALVDTLTQDAQALQALSASIAQSAQKLSKIATVLKNVTRVMQTLIDAITAGLASGII
jgi:glutamine synthetase adenylyltransferase